MFEALENVRQRLPGNLLLRMALSAHCEAFRLSSKKRGFNGICINAPSRTVTSG